MRRSPAGPRARGSFHGTPSGSATETTASTAWFADILTEQALFADQSRPGAGVTVGLPFGLDGASPLLRRACTADCLDSDRHLATRVTASHLLYGFSSLRERVRPVENRRDLTGLHE